MTLKLRFHVLEILSLFFPSLNLHYLKADRELRLKHLKEFEGHVEDLRLSVEKLRIAAWASRLSGTIETFERIQPMIVFMQRQVNENAPQMRRLALEKIATVERRTQFLECLKSYYVHWQMGGGKLYCFPSTHSSTYFPERV